VGYRGDVAGIAYLIDQYNKLISSQTGDNIDCPAKFASGVPQFLAEVDRPHRDHSIIDNFEAVQVYKQNGKLPLITARRLDGLGLIIG